MTVANPVTYSIADVDLGAQTGLGSEVTTVNINNETILATLAAFRNTTYSAQGNTTTTGDITAVYDITTNSAYDTLLTAAQAGTSISIVYYPEGNFSGKETLTFDAIIGFPSVAAEAGGEIQVSVFNFSVDGSITYGAVV